MLHMSLLKPRGRGGRPGAHFQWRFWMLHLQENCTRNENPPKEFLEDVNVVESDEVIERAGIGDDEHAEAYWPLAEKTRSSVAMSAFRSSAAYS